MKAMEHGKRVESDMATITKKYKALAEKAGFDFWKMNYELWPNDKINTRWSCTLERPNVPLNKIAIGYGKTQHQAYLNALKQAKAKTGEE